MNTLNLHFIRRIALVVLLLGVIGCADTGEPADDADATSASADESSAVGVRTANQQPASNAGDGSPPALTFDTPSPYNFGDMMETEVRDATVRFTNTGGSTLVINDVTTTCGCTAASMSKMRYAPGETGELSVTFDPTGPNEPGQPQRKYVNIDTNANVNGEPAKFMILANVRPFIILEPRMVTIGERALHEEHRQILTISSGDPDFELVGVTADSPILRIARLPAQIDENTGTRYERVQIIVPDTAPWGGLYCRIDVTVRGRPTPEDEIITHTAQIRFGAQLYGKLKAEPRDRFGFGVKPNEAFEREVTLVRSDGQPFRVITHQLQAATLPQASVQLRQDAPNRWTFVLSGRGGGFPTNYNGRVVVTTDVPGEENIEIPIFGVVRE